MNIIFGQPELDSLDEKYVVLELDTVMVKGSDEPMTAYCVLDHIPIMELVSIERYRELHNNLMKNYRLRNWSYCRDAIGHLHGQWGNQVDSFYENILQRISQYEVEDPGENWTGIINR